ncbi:ubiquitin carboxyl-terminal hydrolase 8-like isoform X2 [Carica papaya]|uniref:ubiquitin carboxyl-terminal hydrolase 8-like isoform X2 n=1 Tax=Carica papaya TaxID=3649 RepID=UPI000B8CF49C|nr:ubiquitin carboxyl-terminal hydrolase 8-like isoform X2 [Carica papaya]
MSRITEKLRFPVVVTKSTAGFLSLSLARLSDSTIRLCKLVVSKTLAVIFSSMDDLFFADDDFDLDIPQALPLSVVPASDTLSREVDGGGEDRDKLYLVKYGWLKETQIFDGNAERSRALLYSVSSVVDEADSEIVLHLREEEGSKSERRQNKEEGTSGSDYVLLPEAMWVRALKWHNDHKVPGEDDLYASRDHIQNIFPLQISLSLSSETNSLVVNIKLKDNFVDPYKKACDIFSSKTGLLHIWDFSGRTSQFFVNDGNNLSIDSPGQSRQIHLRLYVYGFSDSTEERNDRMEQMSQLESLPGVGQLGLTGLKNLGNTCFMNSAIQCLAHTPELVDFFLGDYWKEINYENPLGVNGKLALSFGELLRKLWVPGAVPVAPGKFKLKLSKFAPQFSGYNQHDSQEFLAFLLDGLHEDLNRVKHKPYIEVRDAEGRLDEEIAEEYWRNHLARNDSIIVDLYQGQYRSTLVCPVCKTVSVTFDPFMYLSLPLPSTTMRKMTLTVLSTDGVTRPCPFTITVPKCGRLKDLIEALSIACSLRNDESLLVAEIYRSKIFRMLDELSDSLALIRDDDKLVAYRLSKATEAYPLVVFMHHQVETFGKTAPNLKLFGIPLVARLNDFPSGPNICSLFMKLLGPFLMPVEDVLEYDDGANEDSAMEDTINPSVSDSEGSSDIESGDGRRLNTDFQFYLMVDKMDLMEIKMDEPLLIPRVMKRLDIVVFWKDNMNEKYDTYLLSSLPEVFKPQIFTRKPQESVSLYKCLEAFLKEEPLGPEDMWYCPNCKKHRQAIKKLDLWRLPEILVIHLKRFSYSRFFKNKLETFVDFPVDDLDLSGYITHKNRQSSNHYMLYAMSNHYGGMGGGHYTASVAHQRCRWYEFDDESVSPISEDDIKTSAAYVLFYRRIPDT